jgi:hypothetical protein
MAVEYSSHEERRCAPTWRTAGGHPHSLWRRIRPIAGVPGWRRSNLEQPGGDQPQQQRHQHDHHDAADVLDEAGLPTGQGPQNDPELPDELVEAN